SSTNYQEVSWMTVALQVSPPLVGLNAAVTLNAYASMSLANTIYALAIYDKVSGWITQCWNVSSCTTTVTQPGATTRTFIAYVDTGGQTNPPSNIRALSASVPASWVTVALRACNYSRTSGCPSGSWTNG